MIQRLASHSELSLDGAIGVLSSDLTLLECLFVKKCSSDFLRYTHTVFELGINGFRPPINLDEARTGVSAVLMFGTKVSKDIPFPRSFLFYLILPNMSITNEAMDLRIYNRKT